MKSNDIAVQFVTNSVITGDKFFIEAPENTFCYQCKRRYDLMHKTTNNYWCAKCYIQRFCDVISNEKGDMLLKMKNSTKIIFLLPANDGRDVVII